MERIRHILAELYFQPQLNFRDHGFYWGVCRILGLIFAFPVFWGVAVIIRVFVRGEGWKSFYLNYLFGGLKFLLIGFLAFHIYVISKYGWRKFFGLIFEK